MGSVNKVVINTENGPETLIDISGVSVTPETLAEGVTAPDASGEIITGTMPIETIPDYVIEEAESTIAKVSTHGNLGRTIRFIAISDTHEDSEGSYNPQITISNKHAGQAIKYIADKIDLDFVAHLGDASSRGAWTTTYDFDVLCEDIKQINKFVFSNVRSDNKVYIPGNHDMISMDGLSLLNLGAYTLFGSLCSGNKDQVGGYGYFDIEDSKVRVIYLNTSDSPSTAAYLALTQAQKNWLCETLIDVNTKSNADEWKVILLSHAPLDFGGADISTDILIPYVNGGSYNGYTFSNNDAKIISNIHGHVHCYSYGYIGERIRRFTIPNACYVGANHYASRTEYANWTDATTYNKTANSGKDTAFSLVTIDLDSGECYVDNYGAGIDRAFSTDYKPAEVIVPTAISNIIYNGDATVGEAIDKSKFTFTVTYSNGTTNAVTGATSVTPATIGVVGNNSVTVTYTEGTTTLTGTVTIVGEAKPVANLLNLNRTYVSGTVGEKIGSVLDESKAYLNAYYGNGTFNAASCTVSNVTENSVTVKESGVGGICVGYLVKTSESYKNFKLTFDYSGAGKCRVYYTRVFDTGATSGINLFINDTAGASGTAEVTIPLEGYGASGIVIYFSSNTGNTKNYTNVSLLAVE